MFGISYIQMRAIYIYYVLDNGFYEIIKHRNVYSVVYIIYIINNIIHNTYSYDPR